MKEETLAALAALPTGVHLLTTGTLDQPSGMIVSWVTQVSFDPPLILAAVRFNRFLHDLIPKHRAFALNLLPARDQSLLQTFKTAPPPERFRGLDLFTAATGTPLLRAALAFLDCTLAQSFRPGDHTLYCGRVQEARRLQDGPALTSLDYGHSYLGRY